MESLNNNKPLTGGEQKIEEYVTRIKDGESKDSIFQGLPQSFASAIEKRLSEKVEEETEELREQDAQMLATLQEQETAVTEQAERRQVDHKRIEELRHELGVTELHENAGDQETQSAVSQPETSPTLTIEERKKLHGWPASYELAKIAKQQGIDLSTMSREGYADFAIQNSLAIDDDQLRVAPWQRMGTSVQEIVLENRERKALINDESDKAFAKFSFEMKERAAQENRFLSENIRVRQGTKDSNSWLFFGINNGTGEKSNETYKSYISVKDLNTLTPERFTQFMFALRDAKYNGDIKIFQDLSEQGIRLNDQIVMHGGSQEDAGLALKVAEQFFGGDLAEKSLGKDEVINGENRSYSQILAKKIAEAVNPSLSI